RTLVTSIYDPNAPPSDKVLVMPLYVTEPSKAEVYVYSMGSPKQANLDIIQPTKDFINTTTSPQGRYDTVLRNVGKYFFVVSAPNVKSLSARVDLNALQTAKPLYEEPAFLLLLLLIIFAFVMGYYSRDRIIALFTGRLSVKMKLEKPIVNAGEEVSITLLDHLGRPASNKVISILNEKGESVELRTDEKGRIIFIPSEPGLYLLSSETLLISNGKIEVK
ncbi:DUF4198 domain-containing protein, partial [Candidatus Micrarchaeota archaeon]|nr:DUF4198 domain-containing protein [Candidatus Micrarchaeota archaeon]